MRGSLVVGNWKMNGTSRCNQKLITALKSCRLSESVTAVLCPPSVYLAQIQSLIAGSELILGAQDVSAYECGAYTGDVSVAMISELGCQYTIVGHSERREYQHESDSLIADKCVLALKSGITPIACVGESEQQRKDGKTVEVISSQLNALTEKLTEQQLEQTIVAYEPIWAIGTGLTATPEQAQHVHSCMREQLGRVGQNMTLLYGGSVKPDNAAELFAQNDIDGALVGGASLDANDFSTIIKALGSKA